MFCDVALHVITVMKSKAAGSPYLCRAASVPRHTATCSTSWLSQRSPDPWVSENVSGRVSPSSPAPALTLHMCNVQCAAFSTCGSHQFSSGQLQSSTSQNWGGRVPLPPPAALMLIAKVLSTEERYLRSILLRFCNLRKWGGGDTGHEAMDSYLLVI